MIHIKCCSKPLALCGQTVSVSGCNVVDCDQCIELDKMSEQYIFDPGKCIVCNAK